MDWQSWQVQVAAGDGVVARTGGSLVVALPGSPAQEAFVDALLAAVEQNAAEHGADPGKRLARRTAGLVAAAEPDDVPSFGLLSATADGVAALLVGDVALTITGPTGSEQVSGRAATPWVDRLVRAPFTRLDLSVVSGTAPDPRSRLGDGVVRGGGIVLGPGDPTAMSTDTPAVPAAAPRGAPAAEPQQATPVPVPEPLPLPLPLPLPDLPPAPTSPIDLGAPGTADLPAAGSADFVSGALSDPLPADELVPLPALDEPPAAASDPVAQGVQVKGIVCSRSHFNDPSSVYCATCGISMVHQTHNLVPGPRPPLGVLVVDDGSVFTLSDDYVVGREPENSEDVQAHAALPLPLEDPNHTLSRVHAKIVLQGWDVRVLDVNSANGTFIAKPGETDWTRLTPGEPTTILPGTRISLGGRSVVFDSHRKL